MRAVLPLVFLGVIAGSCPVGAAGKLPTFKVERWVNSPPLTAEGLRGKVLLLDVWEYTCINWIRTSPYVKAWHRDYAALGLVACGASLRTLVSSRRAVRWLSPVLAICGGAIGILTLSQHVVGWNLHIDELLFVEAAGSPATASPARMGPIASSSLTAVAIALLVMRRRPAIAQTLALMTGTLAFIALVGYWYRVQELYSVARYTGIAWPTALALEGLSLGLLTANTQVGPAAVQETEAHRARAVRDCTLEEPLHRTDVDPGEAHRARALEARRAIAHRCVSDGPS